LLSQMSIEGSGIEGRADRFSGMRL